MTFEMKQMRNGDNNAIVAEVILRYKSFEHFMLKVESNRIKAQDINCSKI